MGLPTDQEPFMYNYTVSQIVEALISILEMYFIQIYTVEIHVHIHVHTRIFQECYRSYL